MSKRRKNTKTEASEKQAELPPTEDAGHPAATEGPGVEPPQAQPEPTEPAGQAAAPATSPTGAGRRIAVVEFADEHGLSRHEAEWLLTKLGLRDDTHDGTTLYDVAAIDRVLAAEDTAKVAEAAELLGAFANDALARRIVAEACEALRGEWLLAADLRQEVDTTKRALAAKFAKMHACQRARRAGDTWAELASIDRFERSLLDAIEPRRQQKGEARQP